MKLRSLSSEPHFMTMNHRCLGEEVSVCTRSDDQVFSCCFVLRWLIKSVRQSSSSFFIELWYCLYYLLLWASGSFKYLYLVIVHKSNSFATFGFSTELFSISHFYENSKIRFLILHLTAKIWDFSLDSDESHRHITSLRDIFIVFSFIRGRIDLSSAQMDFAVRSSRCAVITE